MTYKAYWLEDIMGNLVAPSILVFRKLKTFSFGVTNAKLFPDKVIYE